MVFTEAGTGKEYRLLHWRQIIYPSGPSRKESKTESGCSRENDSGAKALLLFFVMAANGSDFYLRFYVGHKGKFGHEFLEFEFRPDGQVKAAVPPPPLFSLLPPLARCCLIAHFAVLTPSTLLAASIR